MIVNSMVYRFIKEIIPNQYNSNASLYGRPRIYKVLDEKDSIIGESYHDVEQYFTYNQEEICIEEAGGNLLKTPRYTLRNSTLGQNIGQINLIGTGISYFWEDVPSDPNAKVIIAGVEFNFRRISPGEKPLFVDRYRWGHYKFRLYALKGDQFAQFSLKMNIPVFYNKRYTNYRPFEGSIETNLENLLPMFTAFCLMEREFDVEQRDTG